MTDSQHESADQRAPESPDPVAGQSTPPAANQPNAAPGTPVVPAPPAPGHPGSMYGHPAPPPGPYPSPSSFPAPGPHPPAGSYPGPNAGPAPAPPPGYGPPPAYQQPVYPAYPARQTSGAKTGLIVLGVIGLVVVLGIGVAIGFFANGNHSGSASAAVTPLPTTASPSSPPSATAAQPVAAPGKYSISAVVNACDLVDPTPLKKWSSTPKPPVHMEDPANSADGGNLLCQIQFTSTSATDGVTTNEAGISLQVQLTGASGPPAYDRWKSTDTTPQPGWSSGTITGLGAQSYWHAIGTTDTGPGGSYIVGTQDSNISVRVEVAVLRARGEAPINEHELATIARSQARAALDRLKKP